MASTPKLASASTARTQPALSSPVNGPCPSVESAITLCPRKTSRVLRAQGSSSFWPFPHFVCPLVAQAAYSRPEEHRRMRGVKRARARGSSASGAESSPPAPCPASGASDRKYQYSSGAGIWPSAWVAVALGAAGIGGAHNRRALVEFLPWSPSFKHQWLTLLYEVHCADPRMWE